MAATLRSFDISDDWDSIIAAIDEDGGVIVRNFISEDLLGRIRRELQPHVDSFDPGIPGEGVKSVYSGEQTKRFSGIARRAPSYAEVIDHDLMHKWAADTLRHDYWMSTSQAIVIGPGQPAQFLHRDLGNWTLLEQLGPSAPECAISLMLAVSDFTAEIGATQVVPGSHRWSDFTQEADPSEVTQAVMPAGSALLYLGRTIHAGGANVTSDQWRFGISMMIVRADMTPEEAICFTTPWEVAQHYSPRVQRMLGFYSLRPLSPEATTLWTYDYRELRNHLSPPPAVPVGPLTTARAATEETSAVVRLVKSGASGS